MAVIPRDRVLVRRDRDTDHAEDHVRTWGGSGVPTPSRAAAGGTGPARTCVSGISLQDGDKSGRNRGQIGVCGWSRPVVTLCFSKRLTRGQTGTRRRDRRNEAGRVGGPDPRRGGSRARWDGVTLTGPRWSRPHEGTGAWGAAGGGLLGRPDLTTHTPRARAAAPTAASPFGEEDLRARESAAQGHSATEQPRGVSAAPFHWDRAQKKLCTWSVSEKEGQAHCVTGTEGGDTVFASNSARGEH